MLKQRIMMSYSVQLMEYAIQLIASILVARIAGPGVFGILIFGLSYVSLINMFVSFGFGSAHLKMVSEGRDLGKCITTYSIMTLINIILFIGGLSLAIFLQTKVFHKPFESPIHQKVVYIYAIYVAINQLMAIPIMTFTATLQQAKVSIPHLIQVFMINGLRIVAVILGYRTIHLAWIQVISVGAVTPLILYSFRGYKFGSIDKDYLKLLLRYSVPLFFVSTVSALTSYLDKVIIQFKLSSETLGFYGASQKIGGLLNMVAGSIGMIFFPLFSKYVSENNYAAINSKLFQFNRFLLIFILPLVLFVSFHSRLIVLTILGAKYTNSIVPMVFFTIGSFIYLLSLPFANLVFGSGLLKRGMYINIISSIFYVAILLVLIDPRLLDMGLVGAALALILFHSFNALLCLVSVRTLIHKRVYLGNLWILGKILIIGTTLGLLERYLLGYTASHIIPFVAASSYLLLFALLLYITRTVVKTDMESLYALLSIKKMKKYVTGEYKNGGK